MTGPDPDTVLRRTTICDKRLKGLTDSDHQYLVNFGSIHLRSGIVFQDYQRRALPQLYSPHHVCTHYIHDFFRIQSTFSQNLVNVVSGPEKSA